MREGRRSPRLTPLRAAWLTYTSRRSYWIVGLLLVVWHAAQWIEWRVNPRTTSVAMPDLDRTGPVWSMAGRSAQQAGAESARYADLMGEFPVFRGEFERTGFPRLETLNVIAQVAPAELELIARLPMLRSLTLMQTAGLSAADLSLLATSTSLKELRIYDNRGYREAMGSIAWPPNLEFLAFISPQGPLPYERIAELSRLPRLKRLSTELRGERWGVPPDPAVLELFKAFPALERLDLYEFEERDPLLGQVQAALPGVMVRPSFYDGSRLRRGWGASVWLWFFLAALLSHVSTQFVGTQAVSLPGHTRPHVAVCLGLLGLAIGSQLALLLAAGFGLVGAIGWLAASLACLALLLEGFRRIEPGLPGLANPYITFPLIMAPVGLLPLLMLGGGGEWDWFARGRLPSWTCLWVVLSGCLAYRQGVWLTGLARLQERYGRGGMPLGGFKLSLWKEYELARLRNVSTTSWNFRDWVTGATHRLEQALQVTGRRPSWLMLNRAADPMSTGRFLLLMSSFLIVFLGVGWLSSQLMNNPAFVQEGMNKGIIFGVGTQLIVMPLFMPWGHLWTRKPQLGMELLRPISRRDWVRGWFRDMAGRMLPCVATTGLVLIVATMVKAVPPLSMSQWGLVLAATGGVMLLSLGLGCWIVTWRHGMLAMLFPVLLTAPFCVLIALAPHLPPDDALLTHPATPWLALGVLYVLGAGSIALAYRRWQRWELGRLT